MSNNTFKISVTTLPFLEPVLAEELTALGAREVETGRRIVHCTGDKQLLYRANYELRTALRVFVPIHSFNIRHSEELHKRVLAMDWTDYLDLDKTFAIEPNVHSIMFKHAHFASLRMKDGIADFFNNKTGRRPSVDAEEPDVLFNLHIDEHRVTISLDSSGDSLNRRGYRVDGGKAPLNEVLAAGMILLTGYKGDVPFYDPMCGSGTLAIEAAMIAANIPVQQKRTRFGFMNWKNFDQSLWDEVRDKAYLGVRDSPEIISASDTDRRQLETARQNIEKAGLTGIKTSLVDFLELKPAEERGMVVLNPPYGERLDESEQVMHLYKRIGGHLKHGWPGHEAWLISSNPEALKLVGLKPSRKIPLMNGTLECRFLKYELFGGKRAEHVVRKTEGRQR